MTKANDFECPFSGQPAEEFHHPTGRDCDGNYLDPTFVFALSKRQHNREHQSWDDAFKEDVSDAPDRLRLRRVASLLIRLGQNWSGGVVELRAEFLVTLGLLLHRIADRIGEDT
jgi:hypothetical protein